MPFAKLRPRLIARDRASCRVRCRGRALLGSPPRGRSKVAQGRRLAMGLSVVLLAWHGLAIMATILLTSLPKAWRGICNDFKMLYADPALGSFLEGLVAYPGFWALFWYRLSHALYTRKLPFVSTFVPRLIMSIVRYCTAVDIHPAAVLSEGGLLLDHATGVVIGATAQVGARTTIYHQVTLGATGKALPPGAKRHPTIGDDCVIGAGAKVLGPIVVGNKCAVGANSVVTKAVPSHTTVVGMPARPVGKDKVLYKCDPSADALYNLHVRLSLMEARAANNGGMTGSSSSNGFHSGSTTPYLRGSQSTSPIPNGESTSEDDSSRPATPPPGVICEQLLSKLRGLQEEDRRCAVGRYWSKLACDKRLCFAALNNVLQDTVEVTPEIDSSLSSAML